jgi:monoamine oxidase
MKDNNILDVAVVGGGISGVYSAWRLLTDGGKKSVTVYEADNHIGGRLLSVKPPKIDKMVAELGGMRILPEKIQPLVNTLICKLNKIAEDPHSGIPPLDLYNFPVNGQYTPDKSTSDNIVFTRGTSFRWLDITNHPDKVPYKLKEAERGESLGNIILKAIKAIIPGIIETDSPEVNRRKAQQATYKGLPLYQQGFWDILTQVISYEAYKFEMDAGGYSTTLSNWNAADAIPWFLADFSPSATYRGFAQGYRQVVVNMAQLLTNAGGNVVCGQKLASFDWDGKIFTLKFSNGNTVAAKALILAMPRRSLELISCGNKYLSDESTSKLIKSVTPQPAFKIFSTYQKPWWKDLKLTLGRSLTDLPIRQTYYWANSQGEPIKDGPAMLMASYDDGNNPDFWSGYRDWEGAKFKLMGGQKNNLKWTDNAPKWENYEPKQERMKAEMTRQLSEMHGVAEGEIQPTSICYKNWAEDPFGGGWNFWNIGVQSQKYMQDIIQPHSNSGLPLYICGDAYSNWQGWVEGALETANMMLANFEVKPL